jgi:uncharacterized DUF497 family protein
MCEGVYLEYSAIIFDMEIVFEWDARKSHINLEKHKVSFDEAKTVFHDPLLVTFSDEFHSKNKERFISMICQNEIAYFSLFTLRTIKKDDQIIIRIISCRKATGIERKTYEELQ